MTKLGKEEKAAMAKTRKKEESQARLKKSLIRAIMAKTHRDFKTIKKNPSHPSILMNFNNRGTCIVRLDNLTLDELHYVQDHGNLNGYPGKQA